MTSGNALVFALSATVALLLAGRALRSMSLSGSAKIGMALAWVMLIVVSAVIAGQYLT